MTREYNKRKPSEIHAITFTPRKEQMKKLAKSMRKEKIGISALLRDIIDIHYSGDYDK